jgi:hypothetical protein
MRVLTEANLAKQEVCEAFVDFKDGNTISIVSFVPHFILQLK